MLSQDWFDSRYAYVMHMLCIRLNGFSLKAETAHSIGEYHRHTNNCTYCASNTVQTKQTTKQTTKLTQATARVETPIDLAK